MNLVFQYNSSLSLCYITCVCGIAVRYSVVQKFDLLIRSTPSKSRRSLTSGCEKFLLNYIVCSPPINVPRTALDTHTYYRFELNSVTSTIVFSRVLNMKSNFLITCKVHASS